MTVIRSRSLDEALAKLKSLYEGDVGLIEVTAFGAQAVPALRMLLFDREPSGLYQTRCRAVHALAALGAYDVLVDFLALDRDIGDPVERVGEDAVINAAARAVGNARYERAYQVLLALAGRRTLPGVIAGLGSFRRPEVIPHVIVALEEDDCRYAAERILRDFGEAAFLPLLEAVTKRSPSPEMESVSSRRRRESALKLLGRDDVLHSEVTRQCR
jgi:hypothetical protein